MQAGNYVYGNNVKPITEPTIFLIEQILSQPASKRAVVSLLYFKYINFLARREWLLIKHEP
jgi:hypothetical protein